MYLGEHAWVEKSDSSEICQVGIDRRFVHSLGTATEFIKEDGIKMITQGNRFLTVRDECGLEHGIWAPVSGAYRSWNDAVIKTLTDGNLDLLDEEPWILEILTSQWNEDKKYLKSSEER